MLLGLGWGGERLPGRRENGLGSEIGFWLQWELLWWCRLGLELGLGEVSSCGGRRRRRELRRDPER